MWKGWIIATQSDRIELESFGIKLGPYDCNDESFEDCELSQESFEILESHWGTYFWCLKWV
jgi:hypothetical protein